MLWVRPLGSKLSSDGIARVNVVSMFSHVKEINEHSNFLRVYLNNDS